MPQETLAGKCQLSQALAVLRLVAVFNRKPAHDLSPDPPPHGDRHFCPVDWAARCGAECVNNWNATAGKVVNLTAKAN